MTINPYLYFNGQAAEAIAFYEKVFGKKAVVAKYSDAKSFDSSYEIASGTEELVMHASMELGEGTIMFCDVPPDMPYSFSNGLQLMVTFGSEAEVKKAFDALKDGGEIICNIEKSFWSECFGSVSDKYGICWLLSYENEAQKNQTYGK